MRKILVTLVLDFMYSLSNKNFIYFFNFINSVYWKYPLKLKLSSDNNFFNVSDNYHSLTFSRKKRITFYFDGLKKRLENLNSDYFFNECELTNDSLVIDCGSNIGECSYFIKKTYGSDLICIEPDLNEFNCISKNVDTLFSLNKGLWKHSGTVTFYSRNDTGDSSIIETENYDYKSEIEVISINDLVKKFNIKKIDLLKLEAEGAEPEILHGARDFLKKIKYISADLGPERGLKQENTISEVCNLLFSNNFTLVKVNDKRQVYLFKNKLF